MQALTSHRWAVYRNPSVNRPDTVQNDNSGSQYFAYICMNITHTSPEVDSLGRKFSKESSNLNYDHRKENCNGDHIL